MTIAATNAADIRNWRNRIYRDFNDSANDATMIDNPLYASDDEFTYVRYADGSILRIDWLNCTAYVVIGNFNQLIADDLIANHGRRYI